MELNQHQYSQHFQNIQINSTTTPDSNSINEIIIWNGYDYLIWTDGSLSENLYSGTDGIRELRDIKDALIGQLGKSMIAALDASR